MALGVRWRLARANRQKPSLPPRQGFWVWDYLLISRQASVTTAGGTVETLQHVRWRRPDRMKTAARPIVLALITLTVTTMRGNA